jgi:hypothetical protein
MTGCAPLNAEPPTSARQECGQASPAAHGGTEVGRPVWQPRLLAAAEAARSFSDARRTREAAGRAADKARAAEEKTLYASALLLRTWADKDLGALDQAAAGAQEARAIFAAAGDAHGEGRALIALSLVAEARDALDEDRRLLEEALELSRRNGDWRNTAPLPPVRRDPTAWLRPCAEGRRPHPRRPARGSP